MSASIRTSDGTVVSASVVLQSPELWSPAFVSAALQAEKLQEIREKSAEAAAKNPKLAPAAPAAPKIYTVGIAHEPHANGGMA